jgi:hypothetical protein
MEAAQKHLAELELGFGRDSQLAPWLRLLLLEGHGDEEAGRHLGGRRPCQEAGHKLGQATCAADGGSSADGHWACSDIAKVAWQLAQEWTDLPAWRPRLAAACAAAGLPPPSRRHEWLPLATGTCVVFEVKTLFKLLK